MNWLGLWAPRSTLVLAGYLIGSLWYPSRPAWAMVTTDSGMTPVQPLRMDIEWVDTPLRPWPQPRRSVTAQVLQDTADGPQIDWVLSPSYRRLSIALQRWSTQAGWQLVWEADRDFPVEVQALVRGTFTEAVREVMRSVSNSDHPLQAVMNPSDRIMRIRHRSGITP